MKPEMGKRSELILKFIGIEKNLFVRRWNRRFIGPVDGSDVKGCQDAEVVRQMVDEVQGLFGSSPGSIAGGVVD